MMNRRPPKNGTHDELISTLLVDGNALYKTGYHGAITDYNSKGEHIGGLYQFITVLRKLIDENLYHRVLVFWDGKFSGKLRWNLYEDYKANRNKDYINGTIPEDVNEVLERVMVQEYLEELFIRQIEDDIVEGDDFIAYSCLSRKPNEVITICTNDRDMCQLITENVQIYLCDKKVYVNKGNYHQYFKHHIKNSALIKVISGDSSDNIKGIKGVKEGTLLKHFPELAERPVTLEELLAKAQTLQDERIASKKKPLAALTNLIEGITDGKQGKRVYEINKTLMDLSTPLITEEGIIAVNDLISLPINPEGRSMKNVYTLMKRDGIDARISNYSNEYLMPFKKLMEREKKLYNKTENENNTYTQHDEKTTN